MTAIFINEKLEPETFFVIKQGQLTESCQPRKHDTTCVFLTNCFSVLGLPDELIQKGKDVKSISEIEENGDTFKVTVTTGSKVLSNSFTIGKEAEVETITGEKVKVSQDANEMHRQVKNGTLMLNPLVHQSRFKHILSCFFKAVVHREGNKLKVSLKGIDSVTELVDGNTIVNVSRQSST